MLTSFRLLSGVMILSCLGLAPQAADKATAGKILILENERSLEGEIEKHGDQYRVKRSVGETWVTAEKVLHVCNTREEAYAYLRQRANLADVDERLRLANWCFQNGLREQALTEVSAAVELRPSHAEARRLQRSLQRSTPAAASKPTSTTKDTPVAAAPAVQIDLTAECLSKFVTHVQPILMNACASCHAAGKTTSFKLSRAFDGGTANRKTVQANVAAVIAQVNVENPELSPLLIKAVSIHGDVVQPPLKGRQTPAYKTLEDWLQLTLASNPQLRSRPTAPVAFIVPEAGQPKGEAAATPAKFASNPPQGDAFDPAQFNRQMHPEKK